MPEARKSIWRRPAPQTHKGIKGVIGLAESVAASETTKNLVLEHLTMLQEAGAAVLKDARYPVEHRGAYAWRGSRENCEPVDVHVMPLPGELHFAWPFFPDLEDLTKEGFAAELIFRAGELLSSIDRGDDAWTTAERWIYLMQAYYPFRAEVGGMAATTLDGITARERLKSAQDKRRTKGTTRKEADRQSVEEALAELKITATSKLKFNQKADRVKALLDSKNRKLGKSTIERRLRDIGHSPD
jgi:hypothetical protein